MMDSSLEAVSKFAGTSTRLLIEGYYLDVVKMTLSFDTG